MGAGIDDQGHVWLIVRMPQEIPQHPLLQRHIIAFWGIKERRNHVGRLLLFQFYGGKIEGTLMDGQTAFHPVSYTHLSTNCRLHLWWEFVHPDRSRRQFLSPEYRCQRRRSTSCHYHLLSLIHILGRGGSSRDASDFRHHRTAGGTAPEEWFRLCRQRFPRGNRGTILCLLYGSAEQR